MIRSGELDTLVRLERPIADTSLDGAGAGAWELVDEIWIGLRDVRPARDEQTTRGTTTTTRRARVRLYWRDDIGPEMRFVSDDRIMQIVSPIAMLGRRAGLELMVEDYAPAGNPA